MMIQISYIHRENPPAPEDGGKYQLFAHEWVKVKDDMPYFGNKEEYDMSTEFLHGLGYTLELDYVKNRK